MAAKRGKSLVCGKAAARARLAVAMEYQNLANSISIVNTDSARNATAGNAVLAGIAAADAICCIRLGERSASSDHSDAVTLLAKVDKKLAQDLATLIGQKPISHYGDTFVGLESLRSCMRAMDRLIETAKVIVPN